MQDPCRAKAPSAAHAPSATEPGQSQHLCGAGALLRTSPCTRPPSGGPAPAGPAAPPHHLTTAARAPTPLRPDKKGGLLLRGLHEGRGAAQPRPQPRGRPAAYLASCTTAPSGMALCCLSTSMASVTLACSASVESRSISSSALSISSSMPVILPARSGCSLATWGNRRSPIICFCCSGEAAASMAAFRGWDAASAAGRSAAAGGAGGGGGGAPAGPRPRPAPRPWPRPPRPWKPCWGPKPSGGGPWKPAGPPRPPRPPRGPRGPGGPPIIMGAPYGP
mmetsp:Transcript_32936/g.83597  ORF Transcript_32936/g.83597 Transcript_32936/m.83597 type:complete len:278 (+) Transcript_32936:972-1805(+)